MVEGDNMGNISGKVWGQTELVFANSNIEFHRIDIKKGGTCSKHKHNYKFLLYGRTITNKNMEK